MMKLSSLVTFFSIFHFQTKGYQGLTFFFLSSGLRLFIYDILTLFLLKDSDYFEG